MAEVEDSPHDEQNPRTDFDAIGDWIKEFLPSIGHFITPFITDAISKATGPQFFSPGGFTGGFGHSTLAGTQNVGLNTWLGFNSAIVDSVVAGPTQAMQDSREKSLRTVYEVFAKDKDGMALSADEIDRLMESPLTATSFIHDRVFDQREPHMLGKGLREGIQYMGVGFAPASLDWQSSLQGQAKAMTSAVASSFNDINQAGDWSGASGGDVGRMFAELSRTGALNPSRNAANAQTSALGEDASEEDLENIMARLTTDTVKTTQQAMAAVQSFRQIFKGSVTDVLGYVNTLMGTDVVQTFEDKGKDLYQNFAATGLVTGHTRFQMSGLAGISAQFSQAQGSDPWGSVATGTLSGQLLGVDRLTGNDAFVNPARFKQNIVRQVTSSQESRLAIEISGAYAMIQGSLGDDKADQFLEQINSSDIRSGSQVANVLNTFDNMGGVTAQGIYQAGFSMAGEQARASGIGTAGAMGATTGFLNRTRMEMVAAQLSAVGLGGRDIGAIQKSLQGQALTIENIKSATGDYLDPNQSMSAMGALRMRFGQQSEAFGLGNAFEADQFLNAAVNNPTLGHIQGAVASNVELQNLLWHKGNLSGINNLNAYIHEIGEKGSKFLGSKTIYQALSGDTTPTPGEIGEFANIAGDLQGSIEKETVEARGLDIALRGLFTRTVDGRSITDKEAKHFQAIVSGTGEDLDELGERQAALKAIGEEYGNFNPDDLVPRGLAGIKASIDAVLDFMKDPSAQTGIKTTPAVNPDN